LKHLSILLVSASISVKFRTPVFDSGFWDVRIDALSVLMPKTAPHFDYFSVFGEDYIRFSRKLGNVESKAVPQRVHQATNGQFWPHPFAPNAPHILATPLGINSVGHSGKLYTKNFPFKT
jgi:hypothetical protein